LIQEADGIQQVDADDTKRLLLRAVFVVAHADVDYQLRIFGVRASLVTNAHPAVALVGALKVARRYSICEGEKGGGLAPRGTQPFEIERVLVVQHALQPFTET